MQQEQDQGVGGRHAPRRSTQPVIRGVMARVAITAITAITAGAAVATLSACSPGSSEQPTFTPPSYFKPGVALSRISCSCLACVSAGACEGRAPMARDEQGCQDGFQMQQSTRFEATVSSCQPSCFKRNWSVPESKECSDLLPDDCCPD